MVNGNNRVGGNAVNPVRNEARVMTRQTVMLATASGYVNGFGAGNWLDPNTLNIVSQVAMKITVPLALVGLVAEHLGANAVAKTAYVMAGFAFGTSCGTLSASQLENYVRGVEQQRQRTR